MISIITAGPSQLGPRLVAADRLSRHFKLDTLNASDQSTGRVNLFETYTEMAFVVNQPELFNLIGAIDAFDVDPNNSKIAFHHR